MKKSLSFLAAVLLVAGLSLGQTQSTTFNLSLYLNEYIETMPGPVSWDLGHTSHDVLNERVWTPNASPNWDLAYANCPFTMTISGDNPAGQGKPRFARLESGSHSNGYDTLPTVYTILVRTNGATGYINDRPYQGAELFPYSAHFSEAPHNGQVMVYFWVYANWRDTEESVPLRQTLINPAFTWDQSADAGIYACSLVFTLGAL